MKSWYAIDGRLSSINFVGDTSTRFPAALAEQVIRNLSKPDDTVLDPFAGFGMTLEAGRRQHRKVVGFEPDFARFSYTRKWLGPNDLLIQDRAENIAQYQVPPVDLVVCSPPFSRLSGCSGFVDTQSYIQVLSDILVRVKEVVRAGAPIVVEMINKRRLDGQVIPLAFMFATSFAKVCRFEGEIVFCNKDDVEVSPTFTHSYMMVFRNVIPSA